MVCRNILSLRCFGSECEPGNVALGHLWRGKISHDFVLGLKTRPTTEQSVVAVSARSAESAAEFASRCISYCTY